MESSSTVKTTVSCHTGLQRSGGYFCSLPEESVKALDRIKCAIRYPKGAVLFSEQEPPQGVFVICKGRVKLSISSSEGKSVILRLSEPGEVLGLHAAISGEPYQATAETLEPCDAAFVRREEFLQFLQQNPEALARAAQQLSQNYHIACEQVRSIGLSQSAIAKLAGFLLLWAAKGQLTSQGIRVLLTLTHEQIGQMVGLSRETVSRTLGDFKRRRFVTSKGAVLIIQDKGALEQFVAM